ncbi:hypothetical protein G6L32_14335 [Agrobacterium tumefaciens]|uniref:hypothetical protein n=1 Tax=Agrobacterium tumefaciens TaxID=358 RepID=UPI00157488A4|nr:hypothetical protein [Agrobacterium tumefaciens]
MSDFDFPLSGISFTAAISKRILRENHLEGESGTSRLKQIAFITIVYQMQIAEEECNYNKMSKITGLPRATLSHISSPLIAKSLLKEKRVLNSIGRGHSYVLFVPDEVLIELKPTI